MFAQAMSSTTPVTEKSRIIGVFASRCTELWPRAPGARSSRLALKLCIVLSLISFWRGASTSVMIGWYTALIPVSADASATPGLRRPKR